MSTSLVINKKILRDAISNNLTSFHKDVSDPSHDIRIYEYADDCDTDDFTESVYDELIEASKG